MEGINGDVVQWKKLWQLISGIHYGVRNAVVKEKLLAVSQELQDGILQYKNPNRTSEDKLQKLMKEKNQLKLLPFANKLHQFLDIDALQSWNILCFYLVNEYRGPANSLAEYISSESSMVTLLNDIWSYYTLERMVTLKVVKNMLEYYHSGSHPYSKEYREVVDKIGFAMLRKSYIKQLQHLLTETGSMKLLPGDMMNSQPRMILRAERKLRETNEILQILLLIIHYSGISPTELCTLFKLFKSHSFGRQQPFLDDASDTHSDLVKRVTYSELAIVYRAMDLSEKFDDVSWIEAVIEALDDQIISLHQFPEHGPLLLLWMLFNFRLPSRVGDEDISSRYRQFGSKAVQLGVFDYLHALVSHPMFKDYSLTAKVVRRSIFNQLSVLCQLFDADGSVAQYKKIYDLLSALLVSPSIATEFCKNEENPIRSLFDTSLEYFPMDFVPLSTIAHALATAGSTQNKYICGLMESLPIFTEQYNGDRYELRQSASNEDEFILANDYIPSRKIDFVVPRGTIAVVVDKRRHTLVHFRVKYNYFNALHHEINELLSDARSYSELDYDRIERITAGLRYLAVAVKRIQQPREISPAMVHPTEMVFDILVKFKFLQNPPIELLAQCLNVCAALVPLFEQEIYTRIVNLSILPTVNNTNLGFQDYVAGTSFESSLIGFYLVNFEKNCGRYSILLAYFNFLKTYTKLGKDNIYNIELPGLIFLLREVFPHAQGWRFENESDRLRIYVFMVQYIYEILQLEVDELEKDDARNVLRDVCVASMLHLENGMILLRFVGLGNTHLQTIMQGKTNWMEVSEHYNLLVQHSMTILMHILRLKPNVLEGDLSPLESAIYTQPKQRDMLRIIPVVTGYMNNIFNVRLPILSCQLLRRFAIEFRMSLLACLDMEPDQIRLIFLQRLQDDLESDDLKLAVLEFVEACIHKQPGLTEAFFKINYENADKRLFLGTKSKTSKAISDGIPTYMEEYLDAISNDPKKLTSPLLSRIMSLFHALWKNNMQSLIAGLLKKKSFWSSLCNPLFGIITNNVRAYSQLFNILGIELFKISSSKKVDEDLLKIYEKFLAYETFSKWVKAVFDMPMVPANRRSSAKIKQLLRLQDETPEWLSRLQSFKDLMVLVIRKKETNICLPEDSKKFLAEQCLAVLVERIDSVDDGRPFVILSELFLIVISDFDYKYTENATGDDFLLDQMETLFNALVVAYGEVHSRAKEAILAIVIRTIELYADKLIHREAIASSLTRVVLEIVCQEVFKLEHSIKGDGKEAHDSSVAGRIDMPLLLGLNLLKQLVMVFEQNADELSLRWESFFIRNKMFQRLLSATSVMLPIYAKRKLTVEMLDLLVLLANSRCSEEFLYCDIGDYLWLKLLPPKELLQRPYVMPTEADHKWQTQDWWPIYSKGIELVRVLLKRHRHRFFREAIFFAGIHEEYILDSLLLAKQSMEPKAVTLIRSTLEMLCELVQYEKEWLLEQGQSLTNLMRGIQILMEHAVSLLYRPKILKRIAVGATINIATAMDETNATDTSDEMIAAMNSLIEIINLCAKCLLQFSPPLITLLCSVEFIPCQWYSLVEIQFGAPKLNAESSQLSFGTVLRAVCIFTKVLNLQHFNFHETPLNDLPPPPLQDDTCDGSTLGASGSISSRFNQSTLTATVAAKSARQSSSRTPFSKSLSMTSVSSFTSTNAIALSNELLTHLDAKLCLSGLEFILTLLASQSLLAIKDTNLSQREKQLIKRELSTELLIFHDFVKKRILKDSKDMLSRKKYGSASIYNDNSIGDRSTSPEEPGNPSVATAKKPSFPQQSMRVNVVRKMHLQQSAPQMPPKFGISPIAHVPTQDSVTPQKPTTSTPTLRGILKPGGTASIKRVMFDEALDPSKTIAYISPEDEPVYYEPEDMRHTGLSHVRIVEEDYFQLLSNLFLMITQSEN